MKPIAFLVAALCGGAQAQLVTATDTATAIARATASAPWLACSRLTNDKVARLACFDELAKQETTPAAPAPATLATAAAALPVVPPQPVAVALAIAADQGCKDTRYSETSRFWELEESDDGVRISATWSGQVVATACGKEIKGL